MQPPALESAETNFQEIAGISHPNVHLHDVKLRDWLWKRKVPLDKLVKKAYYCLASLEQAKRLVADQEIEVVLVYNIPQYQFAWLQGVAVVFDYADDYVDMLAHELGKINNALLRWIACKALRRMMERAVLTLSVSHVLAEQAFGNVHVLPNGVSLSKAAAIPTSLPPVVRAGDGTKPVIGFVGSFEYFIDLDLIVDVAKALPQYQFLLVGSGRRFLHVSSRVRLENLGNVRLTGGVPHDQVFSYIRQMDVCLNLFVKIPVSHRACPIKLFEYLSQRKPVISSRLQELEHIDKGFLIYADSRDEVVNAIHYCLANEALVAAIAARGLQLVEEKYEWNKIAQQFAALTVPHLAK